MLFLTEKLVFLAVSGFAVVGGGVIIAGSFKTICTAYERHIGLKIPHHNLEYA